MLQLRPAAHPALPCRPLQDGTILREGDWVSLNGTTGEVIRGQKAVKKPAMTGDLGQFMQVGAAVSQCAAGLHEWHPLRQLLTRPCSAVGGCQAPPEGADQRRHP